MKNSFLTIIIFMIIALFSCKPQKKDAGISVPTEKYTLSNGMTVVLSEDKSDPITAIAILYHVGSSREVPGKTGFAHLFEHIMFQKSENVGED
jgi:zinc protease